MAIAFVQESTLTASSGNPAAAAMSLSPSAGNALVVFLGQTGAAIRTYTISDNIDGSTGWNTAKYANPTNIAAGVFYKVNIPSGITTITVTVNTGTTAFNAAVAEFSGFGTVITVDASDSVNDTNASNTHVSSTSGISSSNNVLSAVSGVLAAAATECAPVAGYTEVPSGQANNQTLKERQLFATGCTNDTGGWTNTGTARASLSVMALLSGNAVTVVGPLARFGHLGGGGPLVGGRLVTKPRRTPTAKYLLNRGLWVPPHVTRENRVSA